MDGKDSSPLDPLARHLGNNGESSSAARQRAVAPNASGEIFRTADHLQTAAAQQEFDAFSSADTASPYCSGAMPPSESADFSYGVYAARCRATQSSILKAVAMVVDDNESLKKKIGEAITSLDKGEIQSIRKLLIECAMTYQNKDESFFRAVFSKLSVDQLRSLASDCYVLNDEYRNHFFLAECLGQEWSHLTRSFDGFLANLQKEAYTLKIQCGLFAPEKALLDYARQTHSSDNNSQDQKTQVDGLKEAVAYQVSLRAKL
ncbi:MAG: hypothetical protein ABW189_04035 [Rickettsiales bacterium]